MPLEKRISTLEAACPARCPRCRSVLTCGTCADWKEEARAYGLDPEELVDRLYKEMEAALSVKLEE